MQLPLEKNRATKIGTTCIAMTATCLIAGCGWIRDVIEVHHPKANSASGVYDLKAVSVTYTPTAVRVGDSVELKSVIRNTGKDAVNRATYRYVYEITGTGHRIDGVGPDLLAGKEVGMIETDPSSHWIPKSPGTYAYKFSVDSSNTIVETDESNNCITGTIIVTP